MKTKLTQYRRTIPADLETPVGIYLKIRDLYPQSALLESSDYHAQNNATSFIGVDPIGYFKVEDDTVILGYPGKDEIRRRVGEGVDVVEELRTYIGSFDIEGADANLPDGLFGYTAYDAVRYFEDVDIQPREEKFKG
ncbi:MAG: anthranilate synthase component I family protein, partial [Duncaniella sp.]|nr:anthranilate synthase component I family protein [Duncaniella sp.]